MIGLIGSLVPSIGWRQLHLYAAFHEGLIERPRYRLAEILPLFLEVHACCGYDAGFEDALLDFASRLLLRMDHRAGIYVLEALRVGLIETEDVRIKLEAHVRDLVNDVDQDALSSGDARYLRYMKGLESLARAAELNNPFALFDISEELRGKLRGKPTPADIHSYIGAAQKAMLAGSEPAARAIIEESFRHENLKELLEAHRMTALTFLIRNNSTVGGVDLGLMGRNSSYCLLVEALNGGMQRLGRIIRPEWQGDLEIAISAIAGAHESTITHRHYLQKKIALLFMEQIAAHGC